MKTDFDTLLKQKLLDKNADFLEKIIENKFPKELHLSSKRSDGNFQTEIFNKEHCS